MKLYSATVKDKKTKEIVFLKRKEYNSLTEFRQEISANGYSIFRNHIAESDRYDWIIDHTNAESWHWTKKSP
jgi:hypothetical protein